MSTRPRLTPAMADVRRAVRENLADIEPGSLVVVALSGGADSLSLAAATAFEAPRLGLVAGAVIVDHGLQEGSEQVALAAAEQAKLLGLDPVFIRTAEVIPTAGLEADARNARYEQFEAVVRETGAAAVLLGHSQDDQAETVLLGLTRGAGATSLAGMTSVNGIYRRPLLNLSRELLRQACVDQGLEIWDDPHNQDPRFTRVRIRNNVLPVLEAELGPGITQALARTAQHLQEDAAVLDRLTSEALPKDLEADKSRVFVPIEQIEALEQAILARVLRSIVKEYFDVSLSATHTDAIVQLITNWHGQGEIHLPAIRVERQGRNLLIQSNS